MKLKFLINSRMFWMLAIAAIGFTSCIDEAAKKESGTAVEEKVPDAVADSANFTSIQWIDSIKNMGSIMEGQKLEVTFRFRNSGNKPLIIQSANPSCGCTVPEKPEEPVMPGQEGVIKAVFDSKGRSGTNHKTITVMANTTVTTNHVLEFNVDVVGSKEGPKATSEATQQF